MLKTSLRKNKQEKKKKENSAVLNLFKEAKAMGILPWDLKA
jgi:hypothetical protein